jgi:molybdopterin/thiamine biosynthesis adenylyltransferase
MRPGNELFSRERLAGYEPAVLGRSVALVVGAGALGQNVIQNLALSGVGEIRVLDKDIFENHNLTRSPAYPLPEEQEFLGLEKAPSVARKLSRLMTAREPVMRYAHAWIQELGDGAFKDVSVVLACVDTPSGRAYLSDKSRLHGVAYVEGGFEAEEITLNCFPAAPGEKAKTEPCWQCSHKITAGSASCRIYAARAEAAGFVPAIQNAAAALAALQSEAAILALHNREVESAASYALDFNIRSGRSRRIKLVADPQCPGLHRSLESEPIKLPTYDDDSVEQLLREIGKHFDRAPTIVLPFPLVWTAACAGCLEVVFVRKPDWMWVMDPLCARCKKEEPGGDTPTDAVADLPLNYTHLSLETNGEVLQTTCKQAGLPILSLVEAFAEDCPSKYFELAGSLDHLFKVGDYYDRK